MSVVELSTTVDPNLIITMNRNQESPLSITLRITSKEDKFGTDLAYFYLRILPKSCCALIHPLRTMESPIPPLIIQSHFHVACSNHNLPINLLLVILRSNPQLAKSLWGDVRGPVDWNNEYWWSRDTSTLPLTVFTHNPMDCVFQLCSFKRISLIVNTALTGIAPTNDESIVPLLLHQCCQYKMLLEMFNRLVFQRGLKDHVVLQQHDTSGNLPIHYSVAANFHGCILPREATMYSIATTSMLLKIMPACALEADQQGRTALELVITTEPVNFALATAITKAEPRAITADSSTGIPLLQTLIIACSQAPVTIPEHKVTSLLYLVFRSNPTLTHLVH
jgi:hypothetical protein